ncbi:mechanosensitive ion channel family protein [Flavihumibacter petaseus]|uniref:MscS family protein n=1 Tax=Flavihumibacter petaseus NBRC 106054 TaxID=1220578 RepID=A0A0E9N121_9BACT|nr:mechanosensitive ion channel domain-containing protein [Flavihumibacter petaseus]GAO43722.1 MscS family protein [Flavihumibacter petaseus NBRC 106054]
MNTYRNRLLWMILLWMPYLAFAQDSLAPQISGLTGNDSLSAQLVRKMEKLTADMNQINSVLLRGLDTTEISENLPGIRGTLQKLKQNLYDKEIHLNLRSLSAERVIVHQSLSQLTEWQKTLEKFTANLLQLRGNVVRDVNDSLFRQLKADTAIYHLYQLQFQEQRTRWQTMTGAYAVQSGNLSRLLHNVGEAIMDGTDVLDEINFRIRNIKRSMLSKTEPFLWEKSGKEPINFWQSLWRSFDPNIRLIRYYLRDNWEPAAWILLLAGGCFWWIRRSLFKIKKQQLPGLLEPVLYLRRGPELCCLLVFLTLTPFVSSSPPAVYIEFLWAGMLLVATALAWSDWSERYRRYWILVVLLFICFGYDNLLPVITKGERWWMLILSGLAVFTAWQLYQEVRVSSKSYPVFQNEVIIFFGIANVLSFLLNILGRFTLAKVLSNSAAIALAHALSFYLLVEILIEAVYLWLEANKNSAIGNYIQFSHIRSKLRRILVFVGVLFWLTAFVWSLNMMDSVIELMTGFMNTTRHIGNVDFTFGSILIFIAVLWIAVQLANLISFVFSGREPQIGVSGKNRIGSWMLLIRLLILSVGFFLAMGAAGIPLDKLAIIIGALGLGIGFGLQNIVNNLVSGVILAFEKPMDVGDVIEIGQHSGRVKEIGIRASKIATADGADIIVPNGDFISQRLINWTHSNTFRRIEIVIGVAYGTDLDKAEKIVQQKLLEAKDILAQPAPSIIWSEMSASSVNMRVLFWTNEFDQWVSLRSTMLKVLYKALEENEIEIPYAQQDLHIRSIDENVLRNITK